MSVCRPSTTQSASYASTGKVWVHELLCPDQGLYPNLMTHKWCSWNLSSWCNSKTYQVIKSWVEKHHQPVVSTMTIYNYLLFVSTLVFRKTNKSQKLNNTFWTNPSDCQTHSKSVVKNVLLKTILEWMKSKNKNNSNTATVTNYSRQINCSSLQKQQLFYQWSNLLTHTLLEEFSLQCI